VFDFLRQALRKYLIKGTTTRRTRLCKVDEIASDSPGERNGKAKAKLRYRKGKERKGNLSQCKTQPLACTMDTGENEDRYSAILIVSCIPKSSTDIFEEGMAHDQARRTIILISQVSRLYSIA